MIESVLLAFAVMTPAAITRYVCRTPGIAAGLDLSPGPFDESITRKLGRLERIVWGDRIAGGRAAKDRR